MNQIPIFDTASFTEEVTLEGAQYLLHFRYNSRGDYWTVDVMDRDGNPLIMGVKVVASYELVRQYGYRAIPPGAIFAADPANTEARIGRDDLPNRVDVVYMTEEEYASV